MKQTAIFVTLGLAFGLVLGVGGLALHQQGRPESQELHRTEAQRAVERSRMFSQRLTNAITRAQHGQIFPGQLSDISEIAEAVRGREEEFLAVSRQMAEAQGGISLGQMMALAGIPTSIPSFTGHNGPLPPQPAIDAPQFGQPEVAVPTPVPGAPAVVDIAVPHGRSVLQESDNLTSQLRELGSAPSRPMGGQVGTPQQQSVGAVNPQTGEFYAPAGAGYVSTRNGTYYAPAGPNGVIDTRTGRYIPTAP